MRNDHSHAINRSVMAAINRAAHERGLKHAEQARAKLLEFCCQEILAGRSVDETTVYQQAAKL